VTPTQDNADAALAARGDVAAFERLYRRHAPRVHSLARRLLGTSDADDAVQDVFVRAWSKLATFRGDSAFASWLHRLATNVCLRRVEQMRRAPRDENVDLATLPARGAEPGVRLDLATALDRLTPAVRYVVVLFDLEGYSHEEIAAFLGISEDSSKKRLHRGRSALRAFLTDRRP
jgi:RNA polymerase sigma-70 factor (ECF subfamily)